MTMSDTALRAALRLYPTDYRRERGAELSAVFAETTAGAGLGASLREAYDLAGYGLRLRLGLTSAGLPGRALAVAAPFAVGAAAGQAGLVFAVAAQEGMPAPDAGRGMWVVVAALALLPLVSLLAALFGSWRPARLLAVPSVTVVPGVAVLGHWMFSGAVPQLSVLAMVSAFSVPGVLWTLMVPGAPADLLGRVTWPGRALMLAGLLFGLVAGGLQGLTRLGVAVGLVPILVLAAGLAVVAVAGVRRGQVLPLAFLVALLPLGLGIFTGELTRSLHESRALLLVVLVAAAGVAFALRAMPDRTAAELPAAE
jgi:hypothetical protein